MSIEMTPWVLGQTATSVPSPSPSPGPGSGGTDLTNPAVLGLFLVIVAVLLLVNWRLRRRL